MHFQKSPQVLSVVCVPHLGRCYRGGHEHEPLRFLTTRRHVRVKARRCYYESRAPRDPASPDRCQPAPCRVAQSCSTLRPHGLQPASLLCVRDFPGENWSGLPFPPPGDRADPETEPELLASVFCVSRRALYHECHLGSPPRQWLRPNTGKAWLSRR